LSDAQKNNDGVTPPLPTPRRRRHSITSLSPNSFPTSQPSPPKKARVHQLSATASSNKLLDRLTKPEMANDLEIKPRNFEIEEGELWDDLFDIIVQAWKRDNKVIFQKPFDIHTWTDDFILLGFCSGALSAFHTILQKEYTSFGHEVVNMILEYETVGDIASLMVWGDVMEYSRRRSGGESSERKESKTSSSPTAASSVQGSALTQGT
jgi:hypothetical protein